MAPYGRAAHGRAPRTRWFWGFFRVCRHVRREGCDVDGRRERQPPSAVGFPLGVDDGVLLGVGGGGGLGATVSSTVPP